MRHILIIILLFGSAQAQNKKALTLVTYTTAKLSDSMRAQRVRMDVLFWENKQLKERLDNGAYLSTDGDFIYDSVTKTYSINPDAFVLAKKPKEPLGVAATSDSKPIGMPYTFNTDTPKQQQDIEDLKWQIEYFEKLLDDDKKVMDKLHKIIKEQQKIIEQLKKN